MKEPPASALLEEVDAAMKKSKLFTMTQLSSKEESRKLEDLRQKDLEMIESTMRSIDKANQDVAIGLSKTHSTSSFKSADSKDETYSPEKSSFN